jgi:hypothetical protein
MPAPFDKILGPLPLSACVTGAASAALALPPLLAQIQLMLSGAFGLGPLKADLTAQFNASIGISIAFGDPLAALKLAISASASVIAALQASLAIGIPPISIQVSANIALAAALLLKIGGINLLIDLSLGIRLAGINFLAQLQASLSLGGCVLYGWSGQPFAGAIGQVIGYPNYLADGFGPADTTYGVMVVTKAPAAVGAFQFMFAPGFPA